MPSVSRELEISQNLNSPSLLMAVDIMVDDDYVYIVLPVMGTDYIICAT